MTSREIREKSQDELAVLLRDKRRALAEFPAMIRQKKVKNVKEYGRIKKDIARILTIMRI